MHMCNIQIRSLPNEFSAMRAKGWLPKESGHEFVTVDLMNPSPHGTAALAPQEGAALLFEHSFFRFFGVGSRF